MISEYESKVCYFICCEIILGYIERNKTITSDQTALFLKTTSHTCDENVKLMKLSAVDSYTLYPQQPLIYDGFPVSEVTPDTTYSPSVTVYPENQVLRGVEVNRDRSTNLGI